MDILNVFILYLILYSLRVSELGNKKNTMETKPLGLFFLGAGGESSVQPKSSSHFLFASPTRGDEENAVKGAAKIHPRTCCGGGGGFYFYIFFCCSAFRIHGPVAREDGTRETKNTGGSVMSRNSWDRQLHSSVSSSTILQPIPTYPNLILPDLT